MKGANMESQTTPGAKKAAELGRVLGVTNENPVHGCFLVVALVAGIVVGLIVGQVYFPSNGQHTVAFWLSIGFFVVMFVGPLMLVNHWLRREFRIHEYGVSKNAEFLFDAEIVSFKFS